jgi:hypothetical protein
MSDFISNLFDFFNFLDRSLVTELLGRKEDVSTPAICSDAVQACPTQYDMSQAPAWE